ncbi:hypothetical protein SAMN05192529_11572 [Arachidicoccus rhizosphaerae]|uniref:Lipoprotein n=1 Tax=Arachidicoccus rhizosphaerae TaxID=551991 RepID=A0A1H4AM52_9BACT|nr:DUF6624 domain-containing protein [Arachidicoccus rhizosphaerae]SEA36993.1 hypothetical protein SAMN05192529_11572 [Arachidicoccus rhizosphaerae]
MGRWILFLYGSMLFLGCHNTKNVTDNINPYLDPREIYFLRGKQYWEIANKTASQIDTAIYYFEKYLGEDLVKYHPLSRDEERAFCWLPQLYYRIGDFNKLEGFTNNVMRLYSGYFRIVNSIWWNFAESNSDYPHNPAFDKKYTAYFKSLTGFGDGGRYGVQKKILEEVYDRDQQFRKLLINKNDAPQNVPDAINDSIGRIDSMNIATVSRIIDHYGWLGPKDVGVKAMMGEFFTIHHGDKACFLKYYPMVKKAYKDHQLSKSLFEMYLDRRQIYLGKKQIYGTQKSYDRTLKRWVTDPVKR